MLNLSHERVHRQHDGKVDCGSDDHEGNNRIDEIAEKRNLLPWIVKLIDEKSGCLTTAAMNGVSKPFTMELTTSPNASDHHTDGEINRVAPEQELSESFHGWLPSTEIEAAAPCLLSDVMR